MHRLESKVQLNSPYHDGPPICDVTPGAHAAPGRARSASKAASDPLPWRARAQRQVTLRDHPERAGQRT